MNSFREELKKLPGVDKVICMSEVKQMTIKNGVEPVKYAIRQVINSSRNDILNGSKAPSIDYIIEKVQYISQKITHRSLKQVINASGIVIHTNLGRSPMGEHLLDSINEVLRGYNNLEFDLTKGKRGHRNNHAADILKYLTGAEDIVVVNNNAAAVMLILKTFAKQEEVIVSRGELIEIGGSFRIPEIMAASDAKMIEVGATNKTKIDDYKGAITENTALLFKAHKSNYVIKGFTQEVELEELVALGNKYDIPTVYDIGSGLLRKVDKEALKNEPDVKEAINTGVDIVCFSGDKLLGGPQAGIIAGKKKFIEKIKKEPMMRALRVCKTTLAILETACGYYLNDKDLFEKNILFKTLNKSKYEIKDTAELLRAELKSYGINSDVLESKAQYGGGTLPDLEIDSYSVKLSFNIPKSQQKGKGKQLYLTLLKQEVPILANLISGDIQFNAITFDKEMVIEIAGIINNAYLEVFK